MVKRYTPCRDYFDQWDTEGYLTYKEAPNGDLVRYQTFIDTTRQLHKEIHKLKKQLAVYQAALLTANTKGNK